jgi:flap endonuclease-1
MNKFFLGDNKFGSYAVGREKGKFGFIDAPNRIYKQSLNLISKNPNLANMKDPNLHLIAIFTFTIYMLKYGILPIYIFDGKCPQEKKQIVEKRRSEKKIFKQKCDDMEDKTSPEFIKIFKKSFTLQKMHIDECKHLLKLMGLPYIEAREEADQQCAEMAKYYKDDSIGVISDDWDILMFGSPIILKDFSFKTPNSPTIKIEKDEIIKNCLIKTNEIRTANNLAPINTFTHDDFLNFCILVGTDYTVNDKLFKLENMSHSELFELCAIYKFNMKDIANHLFDNNKINCVAEFLNSLDKIREIYINPAVINPEDISIIPSDINSDKIISYLCEEKQINIPNIESDLEVVEKSYYALKKIAENIKNPRNFNQLKSYQYKHYCEQYLNIKNKTYSSDTPPPTYKKWITNDENSTNTIKKAFTPQLPPKNTIDMYRPKNHKPYYQNFKFVYGCNNKKE